MLKSEFPSHLKCIRPGGNLPIEAIVSASACRCTFTNHFGLFGERFPFDVYIYMRYTNVRGEALSGNSTRLTLFRLLVSTRSPLSVQDAFLYILDKTPWENEVSLLVDQRFAPVHR